MKVIFLKNTHKNITVVCNGYLAKKYPLLKGDDALDTEKVAHNFDEIAKDYAGYIFGTNQVKLHKEGSPFGGGLLVYVATT